MNRIWQDFIYGLRMLRKNPGFTLLAVTTLALGIGANTAIFSNVNALVLRPFALPDLDRVVAVWETVPKEDAMNVKAAPANFRDWSEQNSSLEHIAAIQGWNANLTGEGIAEHVEGFKVTSAFFPLLEVPAELGRNMGASDFQHGTASVVVVAHNFWQKHLGGDTTVVGKSLLLNGQKFTVVGVAGRDVDVPAGAEIWAPLDLDAAGLDRSDHDLLVIGRLKKQFSASQATADLQAIANRLAQQFPATNNGHSVRAVQLVEDATFGTRQFVMVLMGAAVFVLLLACVNVANLQLARVSSRQKEMAVRIGLGASRWQLIRQLLIESTLLSLAGGAAGVLLGSWGMSVLRRALPPYVMAHVPGLKHLDIDARVLWFSLAVTVGAGILAGLAPALRFSRSEVSDVLKENARAVSAGPTSGRLRNVLVTSQIALALVLLVGAALMVKGFRNLITIDMGFDRTQVLTFRVALPEENYKTKEQLLNYYDRVLRQLQSQPGVKTAACVTSLPSGWSSWNWTEYRAEGRPPSQPGEIPSTIAQTVTPDFFAALRVPLRRGRLLSRQDERDAPPVVVISEHMARDNWPGQDPIGKHLKLNPRDAAEPEREIVGVVGDIRTTAFDVGQDPTDPTTYVPLAQMPPASSAFVLRTGGDPTSYSTLLAAQLREVDPEVPAYEVQSLEQIISDNASGVQFSARIMLVFGVIALTLAAAGIFALMAYSVAQRTHEIGVRMALGARRVDVLRLVVMSAVKMAGVGLTIGVGIALLLTTALSSALFGVVRIDPPIFLSLTLVLAAVAALAAFIPARAATKVDPMQALRYE